ncbi:MULTISPECIES: rod shape-determining protein [Clostridium]|uniref:Cell shape-determining protein MreB n=1 Tax=Clostridium novyi (strain NT) TaxID=386415 RepID=A0Q2Y7_CLONN|nr:MULTISPECIES: rod shape-determining protein [Clostridium]ABK62499.1 cell shape determining protein, MreB/Mrl family [Clostridium novyi NT]KEH86386.1 rod shape-determining protein MreB [Clostridium novyi A str. 4540]KEH87002.1 rod shape-determining protein MreB [Clostridium novyi A str. NCTC 538]KEH91097.1 rod shape-determining protein MreB [Clostridium novyi A str. BKT29909]KEH92339.1 rod shape-determining protein MreB [Clostridium novyi A str. GD211209]
MFFRMSTDMGIDLGTATVLVYIKGKGIVLQEPSVVAIDRNKNKVLAVGEEARQMIGRTPGNIVAIRPLKDGVISDYDITERMLKHFIRKACGKKKVGAPRVVICVPCEATEVEKRAVKDAAVNAGAKKVFLIEEPLAAAIGSGLDITKASGNMVIDIGGGTTDIAVISLGGMVVRNSIKIAGDNFDEDIIKYIRKKHKLMIGERTAEQLKINIGTAFKREENATMDIKGRDLVTGLPKNLTITSEEMREALSESVNAIAECTHSVLEKTPPELAADIADKGIVMTGGGALLHGLDKLIEQVTKVPVSVAEESVSSVALGTGNVLKFLDKIDASYKGRDINLID